MNCLICKNLTKNIQNSYRKKIFKSISQRDIDKGLFDEESILELDRDYMELQFHFAKVEKDIDEFLDGVEYEHRYVKKLIMERQKSRFRKGLG